MPRGEERTDERESALLEVSLPIVALLAVLTIALLIADVASRAESMGWWFFAVSGAALTGLAGTCTLLWLQRRGRRVPVAIILFCATLPWLTGLGGMRFGMSRLTRVLEDADWSVHGAIALLGYAEASASAAYGELVSVALLVAIAIVLGVRTEPTERSRAFVAVTVALVVAALVGPAMAIAHDGAASVMFVPLVAGLIAFGACAGRRSAFAVAVATFLATVAACSAATLEVCFPAFRALGGSSFPERREILEDLVLAHEALVRAGWIATGAVGLAALLTMGESMRRADRSLAGRAVGIAIVALLALSLHRVSTVASIRTVEAWTSLPWQHIDGFTLAEMRDDDWASEPWLVVTSDAIWLGETTVETSALGAALEAEQRRRDELSRARYERHEIEETPEWLEDVDEEDIEPSRGKRSKVHHDDDEAASRRNRYGIEPSDDAAREQAREYARLAVRYYERPVGEIEGCALGGRPVTAAVDARATVTRLFDLFESVGHVTILGRSREREVADMLRAIPMVARYAERDSLQQVTISAPMGECHPNAGRDLLLTTTLDAEPVAAFREFETDIDLTLADIGRRQSEEPNLQVIVLVRPDEGVTIRRLVDFADDLRNTANDVRMVLVRELPELPATELPNEIADAVREEEVDLGGGCALGALTSRELAIEDRRAELDDCARRALTASPDLAADLELIVHIAPDGHVHSARVVGGSAALRPMRQCITDVAHTWRFPEREEGTRVWHRVTLGEPDRGFQEG